MLKNHCLYLLLSISLFGNAQQAANQEIEAKVETLLAKMTLKEKIGQMNQYNGFWNVTGPVPKGGDAKAKYNHLAEGYVGSTLRLKNRGFDFHY